MTNVVLPIAAAWLAMSVAMAALWRRQRTHGDAGIVDVAWSLGVGLCAVCFAAIGHGDGSRRALVGGLVAVWSLRLAWHVLHRLRRLPEDGRYATLKNRWGDDASRRMFVFFQLQAFWSVLFALPTLLVAWNPRPLGPWDGVGLAIWAIATTGEALADRQLSRFRLDPANRGRVCRDGLWRWSRHPNYFFEWLHWWAYVAFAVGAPWGGLNLLAPACMLFFLFKVTGIPPTEAQALASRGDAYREYQRTTSAFVPWPPKRTEKIR